MLPLKYRRNKLVSIRFRNVSTLNRNYLIEVEPIVNTQSVQGSNSVPSFKSGESPLCIVSNSE